MGAKGRGHGWLLTGLGITAEVCLLNASFLAAFLIRFQGHLPGGNVQAYYNLAPWLSASVVFLLAAYGVYSQVRRTWPDLLYSLVCVYLLAFLVGLALSFWLREFALPRTVFFLGMSLYTALSLCGHRLQWRAGLSRGRPVRLVVVSADAGEASQFATRLGRLAPSLYEPVAALALGSEVQDTLELSRVVREQAAEAILLCPLVPQGDRVEYLEYCLRQGLQLLVVPGLYELLAFRPRVLQADDLPLFVVGDIRLARDARVIKRAVDLSLAAVLLLVSAPVMALVAVAVWLESHGPILYRQGRLGKDGRAFAMLKFRTMVPQAEAACGPVLSHPGDSRITRVGRVLRKLRLDELPQVFNILAGHMSLVGPRPERPCFAERHADAIPGYVLRQRLLPGLTGLAQVSGRYNSPAEDKLRLDLLYAADFSPLLDLRILLQTLKAVLMHKGSE